MSDGQKLKDSVAKYVKALRDADEQIKKAGEEAARRRQELEDQSTRYQ